jgi:DNA-binding NarL/FixJ family response regulator
VSRPPLVVLDGPAALLPKVAQEVAREGWSLVRGWMLPPDPWDLRSQRLLCAGEVADEQAAGQALLCAVRGAAVVAAVTADESVRRRFEEDLRHLGPVERRRGIGHTPGAAAPAPADAGAGESQQGAAVGPPGSGVAALNADQVRLFQLLAEGLTVKEAASACLMGRRTAERRLREARQTLGVSDTAEALLEWKRRSAG